MSGILRVNARADLRSILHDLESVELGLGKELTAALRDASATVVRAMPKFTPYDPKHRADRKDGLPHIRASFETGQAGPTTATVISRHPGAIVHEYGGTIAPKGTKIRIRAAEMAAKAAEEQAVSFESRLAARLDRLLSRHGF